MIDHGRPQMTIPRQNRQISPLHLHKRFRNTIKNTATKFMLNNQCYTCILIVYFVRAQTLQSWPRGAGFSARLPYIKKFTDARKNVLVMTTKHKADGRPSVYRRKNGRFANRCVIKRDHFGGGNVMVSGWIANVDILLWQAFLPNFIPIGHLSNEFDKRVSIRPNLLTTL